MLMAAALAGCRMALVSWSALAEPLLTLLAQTFYIHSKFINHRSMSTDVQVYTCLPTSLTSVFVSRGGGKVTRLTHLYATYFSV